MTAPMTDVPNLLSREELDAMRARLECDRDLLAALDPSTAQDITHTMFRAAQAIAAIEAERDAAYARGLEDAAKVAEKSREHWRSASPQTEPWTPEQMTMRLTEADYLAAAIRALKLGEAE